MDVFVLDRVSGETARVSVSSADGEPNGASSEPSISADGRYVAFSSQASNLVAGDANAGTDVFVHDRVGGETKRVSLSSSGVQANGASSAPSISADGRLVAFGSGASNLVAGDTNAVGDVFVRDLVVGETTRASVGPGGGQANWHSSEPSLSGDGRLVAFRSEASNLVAGDTNAASDVFVRDRFAIATGGGGLLGLLAGETTRVSVADAGAQAGGQSSQPAISRDGRYVAFTSVADLPGSGDSNGQRDVYVRDRAVAGTVWASKGMGGSSGDSHSPALSGEGSYVAFVSGSALGVGDTNGFADVYERDLASDFTTRLSIDDDRGQANGPSAAPALSGDATYAAFSSQASNLVDGDPTLEGVFVHAWSVDPDLLLPSGVAGPEPSAPDGGEGSEGGGCGPALIPAPPAGEAPAGDSPDSATGENILLPTRRTSGRCDTEPGSQAPPVYHAKQYDANPAQGGSLVGEEWAQLGPNHARRVDPEQITTRNIVRCPVGRCGEVRMRTRAGESDPAAADDYSVTRGTSAHDRRLDDVVDMLEAVGYEPGAAAGGGPIGEAVEGWQTLPPGHGPTYLAFSDSDGTDENGNVSTRKLYIDQRTRLALKDVSLVGDVVVAEIFYDYGPRLLRTADLPGDFFGVSRPATVASEYHRDFADDPPPAPLAEPAAPTAQQSEDVLFANALRFRESFGLNADPAFVRATVTDPALVGSIARHSVPLTPPEEQEMFLRDAIQQATADTVRGYGATHTDTFAGSYIDQRNGGLVYVGFTENADAHIDALKQTFAYPDMLRSFPARYSLRALAQLQGRVERDWGALREGGIPINYVAVDERSNTLAVGVPEPTREIERALAERYGPAVRLEAQGPAAAAQGTAPSRRAPLIQAGDRIERRRARTDPPLLPGQNPGSTCTSGFLVSKPTLADPKKRLYRMLTAGHCRPPGDQLRTRWRYQEETKGFGWMYTGPACCVIDAGIISVRAARVSNRVRLTPTRSVGIQSYQRETEGTPEFKDDTNISTGSPGDQVCFTGATTFGGGRGARGERITGTFRFVCGPLLRTNVTRPITHTGRGEFQVTGLREADFVTQPGDSGGPVFHDNQALGIVIGSMFATDGSHTTPSWYYPIEAAQRAVGGYNVVRQTPVRGVVPGGLRR